MEGHDTKRKAYQHSTARPMICTLILTVKVSDVLVRVWKHADPNLNPKKSRAADTVGLI
jgi:hypothetical protein